MRVLDRSFQLEVAREAKFVAFGLCVFLVVLLPGLLFYKAVVGGASASSAAAVDSAVRAKHQGLLEQIQKELDFIAGSSLLDAGKANSPRLSREVSRNNPLELVLLFDKDRKVLDGLRKSRDGKSYDSISLAEAATLIPVDAGFFDSVRDGKIISGIIEIEKNPSVVAIREIDLPSGTKFILIARSYRNDWLGTYDAKLHEDQLVNLTHPEDFKTFRLSDDVSLSEDVKMSMTAAVQNRGWTYSLKGDSGYVYTVLDDLLKRPTIMVQTPWSIPGYLTSAKFYGNFFATSLMAGLLGWWLLRRGDFKNRSKTRRFDGLSGLSRDHLRILVEAFPGYAFALTPDLKYLAASRVLAGVTGQEPSEYVERNYGHVCFENDEGLLKTAFSDLRDRGHWPPVRNVSHSITGLGESHQFIATAHFLSKQDVMLVLLSKKESAQTVRSNEILNHVKSSDSAVA